jgi:SAM-dependent methyltransferase
MGTDKTANPDPKAAVAELWGEAATRNQPRGWLDSPIAVREYVEPRWGSSNGESWVRALARRLEIPPGGTWLSMGCGGGQLEVHLAKEGIFKSMEAFDLSPKAIEAAQRLARDNGLTHLTFRVGDFDELPFQKAQFDVVVMSMSLHHVKELEQLLDRVSQVLKEGGYFLVNEYVGPSQFQFTDLQLAIVAELLATLPERLRQDLATGQLKVRYQKLPIEHWNRWDPSEAIRSADMLPEIEKRFEIVVREDYGGTILALLLEHIVHNFDPHAADDVAFIRLLARIENVLIQNGVLGSDFTLLAMRQLGVRAQLRRGWSSVLPKARSVFLGDAAP